MPEINQDVGLSIEQSGELEVRMPSGSECTREMILDTWR